MGTLGTFLIVIGVLVGSMLAVVMKWREDRVFAIRMIWLSLAYLAFCLIGIRIGLWLSTSEVPGGASRPNELPVSMFISSWTVYGCFIWMRAVPRYRDMPLWLLRFSLLDIVLLTTIAASFAAAAAQL